MNKHDEQQDKTFYATDDNNPYLTKRHLQWTSGCVPPKIVNLVYSGQLGKNRSVFEIACGMGNTSIFLAARGFKVKALDISEIAINKAKKISDLYSVDVDFIKINI